MRDPPSLFLPAFQSFRKVPFYVLPHTDTLGKTRVHLTLLIVAHHIDASVPFPPSFPPPSFTIVCRPDTLGMNQHLEKVTNRHPVHYFSFLMFIPLKAAVDGR